MTTKRPSTGKARRSQKLKRSSAPIAPTRAYSVATNKQKAVQQRVAALAQVPLATSDKDPDLEAIMKVLRDEDEPTEVRAAALQSLQAASFSVVAFESSRGDYRATLRKVAQDKNADLRQRALGVLARQKDGFAQKKLLEGLQNPAKALVPPEKALQLLGYDPHADAYKIARNVVSTPPNPEAKQAALRLLASDATATPMFEKMLLDKNELKENRQISASALHSLDPDKMQEHARNIVLDTGDYDDIKATSLTALSQFGNSAAITGDAALLKSVDRLKTSNSENLQKSASQFLTKYET